MQEHVNAGLGLARQLRRISTFPQRLAPISLLHLRSLAGQLLQVTKQVKKAKMLHMLSLVWGAAPYQSRPN
jgi:hypothetical protein